MPSRAVHQFLPTYEPGAIGAHARAIQGALRAAGVSSEIFTYEARGDLGASYHYRAYGDAVAAHPSDVLVYHSAVGSEVADFVLDQAATLVVDYHNLTPARLFDPWDAVVAENLEWGRNQLARLAYRVAFGLADSEYNAAELRALGCASTAVVPVLVDVDASDRVADATEVDRLRASKRGADWVFVGRIAPNKAQLELVRAFAVYRQVYDPGARLWLVGGGLETRYGHAVQHLVQQCGLTDGVECVAGARDALVAARYQAADVFVCLSEHEGFCVPLLEAMHANLPIVAYGAAAVPETLADSGLVLDDRDDALVAAAVAKVHHDAGLRAALVHAGQVRGREFSIERGRARLLDALAPVLAPAVVS